LQKDLIGQYGIKTKDIKNHIPVTVKSKISSKRIIWLTAGHIYEQGDLKTSDLASTRYRVLHPAHALLSLGWKSEFINEQISQAMGGWGSAIPQRGDTLIISKVFTDFSLQLAKDAKARGATVIVDFCDNFLSHATRGPLQHALLELADKVVASTEALAQAIQQTHKRVNAVISDPVEFNKGAINFFPGKILKLLWFGHTVNIDTLAQFLPSLANYAETQPLTLNVVTTLPNGIKDLAKIAPPNLSVTYTPWSAQTTEEAISASDIVIIPTINSDIKKAKSPNRLMEPLWAGRMVVAGELPAYAPFANSAWVGKNLIEGVKWAIANPKQVTERIAIGQKIIEENFSIQAIANQWDTLLSSEKADSTSPLKTITKTELAILTTQKPNLPSIAIRLVEPFNLMDEYDAAIASTIDKNGVLKIDYQALLMRDLIIVQRDFPSHDTMPLLKKLKALNKKLAYETDDAFHLIPENHPKAFHRKKSNAINDFAKLVDVVTVSTQPLANEFSSLGKVKVIPNLLSRGLWTNEIYQLKENSRKSHPDDAIRIGLIGGANHQNDFAVLREVLTAISNKYKHVQWVAYGDGASDFLGSTLNSTEIEVIASNFDYSTHPNRLAQMGLDIALVPLLDDPFNQCKSNLKFLELGFLGVACVFSNLAAYKSTVIDGENGLLVNNIAESWINAIQQLIENPSLRKKISISAQKEIQANWMLTSQNSGWQEILSKLS
jgi:glycosyltransferase involved in cell wall biosynthesis